MIILFFLILSKLVLQWNTDGTDGTDLHRLIWFKGLRFNGFNSV